VASALVSDSRWKAIPEEKERENLFQDHLDKLYEQERENTRHQRKTSTEDFKKKLQRYVESKMIDHMTTWDQCLKLFSQDRLL
jgi:pre-mRNA-processing factor 40